MNTLTEVSMELLTVMENPQKSEDIKEYYKSETYYGQKVLKELFRPACDNYFKTDNYKNGNTSHTSYKVCCDFLDFCAFYNQTWFYYTCAGGGLFLVVLIAFGVFLILFLKKKRKNQEDKEKGKPGKKKKGFLNNLKIGSRKKMDKKEVVPK
ncbi:unnamed protein product [Caenorhabditis nigoni]